ncbi:MAG: response regulator [Methanomicrobiales archaeon]|nr:response regulator [Methanomicrobiales archaeon]
MLAGSILVVEDDTVIRELIALQVRRWGYTLQGVSASGEEAIEAARSGKPDLVLMDIHLKGKLDGIEAAAHMKEEHPIRIVFVTGYSDPDTIRRANEVQPEGYVIKPFSGTILKSAIDSAMQGDASPAPQASFQDS